MRSEPGRYFQILVRIRPITEKPDRIPVGTRFGADQMPSLDVGHKQAIVSLIVSKIVEKLRDQPTYRPYDIIGDIRYDLKIHISIS